MYSFTQNTWAADAITPQIIGCFWETMGTVQLLLTSWSLKTLRTFLTLSRLKQAFCHLVKFGNSSEFHACSPVRLPMKNAICMFHMVKAKSA